MLNFQHKRSFFWFQVGKK